MGFSNSADLSLRKCPTIENPDGARPACRDTPSTSGSWVYRWTLASHKAQFSDVRSFPLQHLFQSYYQRTFAAMTLIGTSTIVFPKLDKENSAAKRKHVCSVCSRAFKRSEHCIRHQRGRKLQSNTFATSQGFPDILR